MYFNVVLVILGMILQLVTAIVVRVEQGRLRGEQKFTITGDKSFYSFRGISYAKPPVGNLRFKAPQPALAWKGIQNATEFGNICPQFDGLRNILSPGSEDCLFINVYTPSLKRVSLLPVIFVIHGGGFLWGSGNDDVYGPDFLLEYNVVVVTFNYRLDNLGFLCMDTAEVPGNAGMKDQVAALRWVQRNIRNFGGDPNKVTILGQSAGGYSGTYHSLSPMSRGLFRRVISMSGVAITDFIVEFEQQRRAFELAKSLGFEATNTTSLLEILQSVPAIQLINVNTFIIASEQYMRLIMLAVPVVEKDFGQERFLIEPPEVSMKKGRSEVDVLLGYTSNEGIFVIPALENFPLIIESYDRYPEVFVPRSIYYQTTPKMHLKLADLIKQFYTGSKLVSLSSVPQFVIYTTDTFTFSIIRYANLLSKFSRNDNIYLYEFDSLSERNIFTPAAFRYGITGVSHADDVLYVFNGNYFNLTFNTNSTSYRLIQQTCELLTNFARKGNPTPDASLGEIWPKYNIDSRKYLTIGEELTVGANPRRSMVDFYNFIHNIAGVKPLNSK
ncbi:juvenile hormone esterase-like [Maniola hyperantus]|uniref:juvenile hormone esterase-like n=1 Tax=Aphantopus hyperantus TaxID=2795564 RepID=UPI003748EA94